MTIGTLLQRYDDRRGVVRAPSAAAGSGSTPVTDPLADASPEFRRVLEENERYVEVFDRSRLTAAPLSGLAIVACMDARIDVEDALGLRVGDAHIIRNAGGLATEDVVRSLVVSQQLLGTTRSSSSATPAAGSTR